MLLHRRLHRIRYASMDPDCDEAGDDITTSEKPEMDPLATAITAAAKSETGQSLIKAVLLPSAELYGQHLRDILDERLSEGRARNARRILEKAALKLDANQAGYWPPRVVKEVFDDGTLTDDELTAEYLAGVLASSRSPHGRDDRGIALKGHSGTRWLPDQVAPSWLIGHA